MSMILDALRKSEAERRRADVPDLFAEAPAAPPARADAASRRWLWAVAAIVLLAAAAALRATLDPDAASAGTAAPPATEVDAILDPAAGTRPAATAPNVRARAAASPPLPLPAATAASTPAPPSTTAAAAPPATAVAVTPPAVTPTATSPPSAPPLASPPVVASTPGPGPGPASVAAAPAPAAAAPLRLSDLSIEERQQLPALKISMLMWNPSPDRRFAIVDGSRVAEGDRVGDAVVDAITEDGVVLGWQGRRLKVPIR